MEDLCDDYEVLPDSLSEHPLLERVANISLNVHDKVKNAGVHGLLIYNGGKFLAVTSTVFMATDSGVKARALAAGTAGIISVIGGQTGWLLAGVLGAKILKKVRG